MGISSIFQNFRKACSSNDNQTNKHAAATPSKSIMLAVVFPAPPVFVCVGDGVEDTMPDAFVELELVFEALELLTELMELED